ncbi:DUF5777 family beta-barrel protein [Gaetbulibacter sp. M240]|uniref:DUF5777 family beta-barrel protein n=1 Tax=Gaetbulibacter sp. M240 TaxID=3126511 RepID=UPI00374F5FE4
MRLLLIITFLIPTFLFAQDDLLDEIDTDSIGTQYATAAFKGLKIVNFESTKLVAKGDFTFIVAHRFGSLKDGFDTFFGLDAAVTRLNFIFGVSDGLNFGVSRSSYQKIYEFSTKYRLLRQAKNGFPVTVVGFNEVLINTGLSKDNLPGLEFKNRLTYAAQLLISRKVNDKFTVEIAPTFYHENYVAFDDQENSQYALGLGARYKLGKRWSLNADYGWHLNRAESSPYKNPLSIGVDLETGGHVFQMHFTTAQGMNTNTFLGQASGDWGNGDIFFGFNLSRTF